MKFNKENLNEKYEKVIALICIIMSTMVGVVIYYRTPWSITGSIGGAIQTLGALGLPLIAMSIGRSFNREDFNFEEYYKGFLIKCLIPFGVYYLLIKVIFKSEFYIAEITSTIFGIIVIAPFLGEGLKKLKDKQLKLLVGLIFIGSIISIYFPLANITIPIDLSFFLNWVVFSVIGYALNRVTLKKSRRLIYNWGIISALLTFGLRAVPMEFKLLEVSPTLILYSSAVYLFIINFKWTSIHRFSIINKPVNFIYNHKIGIFMTHGFLIFNVLEGKFNITANRFKVILGSAIVLSVTLIIGSVIAFIIDLFISRNENRLVKVFTLGLRKVKDVNSYKHYLVWILSAFIITFVAEAFLREGIPYAFDFIKIVQHKKFIVNVLLVLVVTSPALLFNRVYLVLGIISQILLGLSIGSFLLFEFRGTPLTYSDFFAIEDGLAIAGEYMEIGMLSIAVIAVGIIILINLKLAKYKVREKYKFSIVPVIVIVVTAICAKVDMNYVINRGIIETVTWDIKYSYNEGGFYFSLYDSSLSYKREKPDGYTKENVDTFKTTLANASSESLLSEKGPNIILLQLESLMDPTIIPGLHLSDDPIKNIRRISEENTSGIMMAPAFGGGTARTEFEVLTGMNLDYFSPGEVPFNTYLKKECIESIAYILDSEIYDKTLIHNYQGSFYERNNAYEHLGFERFIPIEYMYDRKLEAEFPEDELILTNIVETIQTTDKRDLIFAIGAQTHGGYDTEYSSDDSEIIIWGDLKSEYLNQIQDYVDDLVMVDRMVGELREYIDNLDEPTMLIAYSDHLPSLHAVRELLTTEQKYSSQYFIYDNMNLDKEDKNIEAYELTTRIFDLLDYSGGVINKFHRVFREDENYQDKLEILQYDILNGKKYIYDKQNIYFKNNMVMGIKEILINDVSIEDDKIYVNGENFNEYSCIYADGKPLETKYVSRNLLTAENTNSKTKKIKVHQLSKRSKSIGSTDEFLMTK